MRADHDLPGYVRPTSSEMSEGEMLTRAREAYIATHRPWRWVSRRIRAGGLDWLVRGYMTTLRDLGRPMAAIVGERDEATAALIMKTSAGLMGLEQDQKRMVAAALVTAIRVGRRG